MPKGNVSFGHVVLVKASAGSGKTYQLTKRYVQLLLTTCQDDPSQLKQVLAITFTNKAANQMKARILDFLKRTSLNQLQAWEHADVIVPLGLSAHQASIIATRLLEFLLRDYHYFAVLTIDSFVNTLLVGCSFKMGLSAKFKIERQARAYLQFTLDELIARAAHDAALKNIFDQFIHQFLFLDNRGGWLPQDDLIKTLYVLYTNVNTYGLALRVSDYRTQDIGRDKRRLHEILSQMYHEPAPGLQKRFYESLEKFTFNAKEGFDVDSLSDYLAREEMPLLKGASIDDKVYRQWQEAKDVLSDICLAEAFGMFNPFIRIYQELIERLRWLQSEHDVVFLEQLNLKAKDLLHDPTLSLAELYYRLAARFRHYLIDEFQDTSAIQWQNLSVLVDEALATGGTLFVVGDSKQAIYGFRGGDSSLFEAMHDEFQGTVSSETLRVNHRSQRQIVAFNNVVFSPDNIAVFLKETQEKSGIDFTLSDTERILKVFGESHQDGREDYPHGVVRVHAMLGATTPERDDTIKENLIQKVREAKERFSWMDMAVLVRSNADVEQVTGWLLAQGLPVQSERTSDIQAHPLIVEIVSLLKFFDVPTDNGAFCAFLLGQMAPDVLGLPHQDLADFCFRHRGQELAKAFKDAYPLVWKNCFERFIGQFGHTPLYELTIAVYRAYGLQEKFPQASAFLVHFLEVIKRKEEVSVDGAVFLALFDDLEEELRYIPLPRMDAIRVLTVHKAKGLEFPVVFLPFLEMSFKVGSSSQEGQPSLSVLLDEQNVTLVRLKKTYAKFCSPLKRLWEVEFKKAVLNELCTMYVALTRAIWEMHIFIPEKAGSSKNSALSLIPAHVWNLGEARAPLSTRHFDPVLTLGPLALGQWVGLLREDDDNEGDGDVRQRGQVWHEVLARLISLNSGDVRAQVNQALQEVSRQRRFSFKLYQDVVPLIEAFLKREDVQPFFIVEPGAKVMTEVEVVNPWGDLKRIDRLIVRDHVVDVLDFKSSRKNQDAHQGQLRHYVEVVAQIYPQKKVRGYILYSEQVP